MKLDQSMVGKKVRRSVWCPGDYIIPTAIGEVWVLGNNANGSETCDEWMRYDDFEILESPKLPSERITEIMISNKWEPTTANKFFQSIIQYLDEEAKKK